MVTVPLVSTVAMFRVLDDVLLRLICMVLSPGKVCKPGNISERSNRVVQDVLVLNIYKSAVQPGVGRSSFKDRVDTSVPKCVDVAADFVPIKSSGSHTSQTQGQACH